MTRFVCLVLLGLSLFVTLSVSPALAVSTFYVGRCHTGGFNSINDAANSASVPAGSIVKLCPGFANLEQVIISKSLTIEGMITTGVSYNPINAETGSSTHSAIQTSQILAPTVWVTAGTVNFSNLYILSGIDGTANCATMSPAIFYASGSSGTVNHVMTASPDFCGVGIWVENASGAGTTVVIENSHIEATYAGIVAISSQASNATPVLTTTITGNQIINATFGMQLEQTRGTISNNIITNTTNSTTYSVPYAILDSAPEAVVTRNTVNIGTLGTGIILGTPNGTVTANKIWGDLYTTATNAIGIDLNCNNGTVTGNTITGLSIGIADVPTSFTGKNTFATVPLLSRNGC